MGAEGEKEWLTVLMVAEKPSIAKALAGALGGSRVRERFGIAPRSPVHEYWSKFQGEQAWFRVTATQGHVYSFDFGEEYNDWTKHEPGELFAAPIVRTFEGSSRLPEHLAAEAQGCHALVLWLDCDREGENICFEVMQNVLPALESSRRFAGAYRDRVFRAKFSSLRPADLRAAMDSLGVPDENQALSVDARAEIDLRLGIAFTRFQTQYFKRHFGAQLGSIVKTVSYGPCQLPTLWFCVHRHCQVQDFKPKTYWKLCAHLRRQGDEFTAEGACGKLWSQEEADALLAKVRPATEAKVTAMARRPVVKPRPLPLNTVALLKKASERAGISPGDAMHCAESLYLKGILSYPRTETCRYPTGFDVAAVVQLLQVPGAPWAAWADKLAASPTAARADGADHGDHPPITPVKYATESQCGDSGNWEIYKLVCEHFLATISPDVVLETTEVHLDILGMAFTAKSSRQRRAEFTWCDVARDRVAEEGAADLSWIPNGATCNVSSTELAQHATKPPTHLTESDLLGLMEQHGVGTDASMATHVSNVQKRGYVKLDEATRQLVPAALGLALTHAYTLVDPGLVRPTVRAAIENACARVAKGEARKKEVVSKALGVFERKFKQFSRRVDRLPTMLAVAFSRERDAGTLDSSLQRTSDYTEEENPEKDFTEEQWLQWLKEKEADKRRWRGGRGRGPAAEPDAGAAAGASASCSSSSPRRTEGVPPSAGEGGPRALPAEAQWDLAARATAAISLDELMKDRGAVDLTAAQLDDSGSGGGSGFRPGASVRIHGLKGAAELNGQTGVCSHQDAGTGRWHIKLPSGDVKALKPENLEVVVNAFRPGTAVLIHGLKAAPELNGQEGICEQWDAAKGRWAVRLLLGEVKALKPDNLQEVQDEEDAAVRAVARVQRELEDLGFGAGYSAPSSMGQPFKRRREDDDEGQHGRADSWRGQRWKRGDDEGSGGQWRKRGEEEGSGGQRWRQCDEEGSAGRWRRGDNDGGGGHQRWRRGDEDDKAGWQGSKRKWSDAEEQEGDASRGEWRSSKRWAGNDGVENQQRGAWQDKGDRSHRDGDRDAPRQHGADRTPPSRPASPSRQHERAAQSPCLRFAPPPPPRQGSDPDSPSCPSAGATQSPAMRGAPSPDQRQGDAEGDADRRPRGRVVMPPPRRDGRDRGAGGGGGDGETPGRTSDRTAQSPAMRAMPEPDQRQGDAEGDAERRPRGRVVMPPPRRDGRDRGAGGGGDGETPGRTSDRTAQSPAMRGAPSPDQRQGGSEGDADRRRGHVVMPPPRRDARDQGAGGGGGGSGAEGEAERRPRGRVVMPPPRRESGGQSPAQPPAMQLPGAAVPQPPPQQDQRWPPQDQPWQQQWQQPWQQSWQQPWQGSGQPGAAAAQTHAGPPQSERLPRGASQAPAGHGSDQRMRLKRNVFRGCDKDGDGYLDRREMLSLAVLTGFDGSDESWASEYARLCKECHADVTTGIAQSTLFALLDDQSDVGFYCTDKQLEEMSAALESDDEA